ncbi:TolC family protein [Anaeromyxobacter sp. PSR-1]|uniref:TolC family protein n=1 Tax=unclassified Anaeromyxobacter TaxID=2620896 RepID=UPI0005E0DC4C|nr:TolC family protein [Anaeromyxobacter sp. PSR-1]GAO04798.1 outer membrane efflux protein [Anaeromyxobacter sp. PSR-1]
MIAPSLLALALAAAAEAGAPPAAAEAAAPAPPVLTLDAAFRRAREASLELRIAGERLAQARTLARKAWSHYLPQVTAGGSYAWNSEDVVLDLPTSFAIRDVGRPTSAPRAALPPYDPGRPFSPVNLPGEATTLALVPTSVEELELQRKTQYGVQAEVRQALLAPRLWPAIRNAYLAEEVAGAQVADTRQKLLYGVAQLYYGAATLREAVAVQERTLETWRRHETDAEHLAAQGAAPRLALLKARTDRARAEQELIRTRNAYAAARLALATLLDRDADFEVERPPEPPAPSADAREQEERAARRPDVEAARGRLALAQGQRREAAAAYLPTLGVSGTWRWASITGFTGEHAGWTVLLGLQWTLFDGGRREAELADAGHRAAEADAALALASNKARDEVRRARLDLDSAAAAARKAEEQAALAREALEQAQRAHAAGAATYLEVADATSAASSAELGLVAATLDARLARLALARAAGTFDP